MTTMDGISDWRRVHGPKWAVEVGAHVPKPRLCLMATKLAIVCVVSLILKELFLKWWNTGCKSLLTPRG